MRTSSVTSSSERLFSAGLGMAEVLTVYLGRHPRALRRARTVRLDDGHGAREGDGDLRAVHAGVAGAAGRGRHPHGRRRVRGAEDRRYVLPPGHIEPLLDPESPYSIAPFCKSFVAVSGAMPDLVSAFRSGGLGPVERVRPRHGRGPGRLQPTVARRLARRGVPALDPRSPRAAGGRTRREGRRRRLRRRLGRRSPSPARIRTSRWTASIRRAVDRDRHAGTRRRRGSRIGSGSRRGTPRIPGWKGGTTWRSWWRRSTTSPTPSRSCARSERC